MARILFVAPFGLGQKTTVWARTLPLARYLAAHGHQVTILIPPWDTPKDAGKRWTDQGVQVHNVALLGGIPATVTRLVCQINALSPQLVHIVKPRAHAGLVQWLLWQRRRVQPAGPRLLLDVDDWEQAWAEINPYPPLVARFLAWQEEWGLRHADGITAASHWLMAQAQRYAPTMPLCYLPNGVAAPSEPIGPSTMDASPTATTMGGEQILFFSRYVEVTPTWLADFWSALVQLRPTAQLTIFGDPLEPSRLPLFQRVMASYGPAAAQQVTWLAYDATRTQALYAQSSCVIFPAQQTPLHEAKCSVRLATTLLHGAPVVASAVGEQAYYGAAGAAALVSPNATPGEFAAAVAQLLADPTRQANLRQQGRQRLLTTYNWETLGRRLDEFYQQFL
ncbi:MAG: glycosyltransferase family 4 protein [Caldilineaceae bacterium]|nr:glycosyltransferase family 4 protein [Caldilineaceae bacterium]